MPIQAASFKLRREIESGNIRTPKVEVKDPKAKKITPTWYEILESMGIATEEIPKF